MTGSNDPGRYGTRQRGVARRARTNQGAIGAGARTTQQRSSRTRRRAIGPDAPPSVDDAPAEAVEAVRYLVASLQHNEFATTTRLGFTSALSGEGVTFVSRIVASVLAHDFRERVCLVDLSWRSRAASSGGYEPSGVGLADVLRGSTTLDEVLLETDEPRLVLVPAGATTNGEGQVFARSDELSQAIWSLAGEYDRLVLDLPPVLVSSTAIPLAQHADALGLVVRHGVTTETQVRTALDRLGTVPFAGVVLNRTSSRIPGPLLRRLADW